MNDSSPNPAQGSDGDFYFGEWIEDPQGRAYFVEWQPEWGVSGPVLVHVPGGRAPLRLLGVLSKALARVQPRSRSYECFALEVTRGRGDQRVVVLEESHGDAGGARRRADGLISEIRNGDFQR